MKYITGTHIQYLHLCHRKLWLFANGIGMEHTSDLVTEGRLIDEYAYPQRATKWQQLEIEGIKIDYYDPKAGIVKEVKKSNKRESGHIAQLKYYLFVLGQQDIYVSHGLLEYPKLRITEEIWLDNDDFTAIPEWILSARKIIAQEDCPPRIKKSLCKNCAYYDFCYIDED